MPSRILEKRSCYDNSVKLVDNFPSSLNLMFIGPYITVTVEELKTNLMSLVILFHFLCNQHVSDINTSIILAAACNTDTTPNQPHRNSNTHRTKNSTINVVIQQNSRKLLMMDIFMSETCWAHKKWNKIASDTKLVFYSSTIDIIYSLFVYLTL